MEERVVKLFLVEDDEQWCHVGFLEREKLERANDFVGRQGTVRSHYSNSTTKSICEYSHKHYGACNVRMNCVLGGYS